MELKKESQVIIDYKETIIKFYYDMDSDGFLMIQLWSDKGYVKLRGWARDKSYEIIKKLKHFFNSIELPEKYKN